MQSEAKLKKLEMPTDVTLSKPIEKTLVREGQRQLVTETGIKITIKFTERALMNGNAETRFVECYVLLQDMVMSGLVQMQRRSVKEQCEACNGLSVMRLNDDGEAWYISLYQPIPIDLKTLQRPEQFNRQRVGSTVLKFVLDEFCKDAALVFCTTDASRYEMHGLLAKFGFEGILSMEEDTILYAKKQDRMPEKSKTPNAVKRE